MSDLSHELLTHTWVRRTLVKHIDGAYHAVERVRPDIILATAIQCIKISNPKLSTADIANKLISGEELLSGDMAYKVRKS